MTPCNRIKKEIIERVYQSEGISQPISMDTDNSVENNWKQITNGELEDALADAVAEVTYEIRHGEINTDVPCDSNRNFEARSVAMRFDDGVWVGWTYWFGGGKHAEPKNIPWMECAYYLNVTEEQKTVAVRTWTKVAADEIVVVEKPVEKPVAPASRKYYQQQFEEILDRALDSLDKDLGRLEQTTHGVLCRPSLDTVMKELVQAAADPTSYSVSTASQIIRQYLKQKYQPEWFNQHG